MYIKQSHLWANIYTCICRILRRTNSKLRVRFNIKLILRNILINKYDIAVKINFIFEKKRTGKHLPISYKSDNIWHSLGLYNCRNMLPATQLTTEWRSTSILVFLLLFQQLPTLAPFHLLEQLQIKWNPIRNPGAVPLDREQIELAEKNILSELLQHVTTNSFP